MNDTSQLATPQHAMPKYIPTQTNDSYPDAWVSSYWRIISIWISGLQGNFRIISLYRLLRKLLEKFTSKILFNPFPLKLTGLHKLKDGKIWWWKSACLCMCRSIRWRGTYISVLCLNNQPTSAAKLILGRVWVSCGRICNVAKQCDALWAYRVKLVCICKVFMKQVDT